MLVVSCCKFVTSQALTTGNIFMGGIWTTWEVLEIFTKMHFSKFCGIFKEGWYKKRRENLKEIKTLTINSRVFLAIKSLTQPWAFESEWNNYMNKCIKLRPLSLLTVFSHYLQWIHSIKIKCVNSVCNHTKRVVNYWTLFNRKHFLFGRLSVESPMILWQVKSVPQFTLTLIPAVNQTNCPSWQNHLTAVT